MIRWLEQVSLDGIMIYLLKDKYEVEIWSIYIYISSYQLVSYPEIKLVWYIQLRMMRREYFLSYIGTVQEI